MINIIKNIFNSFKKHPTKCERSLYKNNRKDELMVLKILAMHNEMSAPEIDRVFHSGGRRANDLYHKGFVDNVGSRSVFKYKLNDKGYDLLLELEKKYN